MTNNATNPTGLSLTEAPGQLLLKTTLDDYVAFLRRQPAFCGTDEQHQALIKHVAQGNELIKLVAAERLKITRQLDEQKHDWMSIEKELTEPILTAMQPLKDAVDHYNRELLRIQAHARPEFAQTEPRGEASEPTTWLSPQVDSIQLPKHVKLEWRFEVLDINQLPNGYWKVDEGLIKSAIAGGIRDIPGVRIYAEPVTTFRS